MHSSALGYAATMARADMKINIPFRSAGYDQKYAICNRCKSSMMLIHSIIVKWLLLNLGKQ